MTRNSEIDTSERRRKLERAKEAASALLEDLKEQTKSWSSLSAGSCGAGVSIVVAAALVFLPLAHKITEAYGDRTRMAQELLLVCTFAALAPILLFICYVLLSASRKNWKNQSQATRIRKLAPPVFIACFLLIAYLLLAL